ncbi:hypothetical protein [Ureaplasma zalophigenitalium]|uniref:Uncharacterized protein n=1 Tax=Ureaplasma zalophigenitalium TaxID=907723 RepID=A0ABT3BPK4_9BACT|nr:hypothetical protein [Ureaplasma zalophigenitalium]MCV3754162.1 hypothetical protein [Ureaplasma zalophigenitalium]
MKSINNFKKPKSKLQIVLAKVLKYDEQVVYLQLKDNSYGYCSRQNISDFDPIDISKIFQENKYYKFMYLFYDPERKMSVLNYKIIHPILIKNKKKSYPTLSHDRNLKQFLNELLAKEE